MIFNVDDLVQKGLVHKKTYKDGPYEGLSVLKYKNSVFWDNLWHTDSRLLDCRGMVVDSQDNVVIWPFTKIFNRFENGTDLPLDKMVVCANKSNGYMAAATFHKDKLLVSTTGTLDSEFARMAESYLEKLNWDIIASPDSFTFIFEICDPSDPHIVEENPGAYLIGVRTHASGQMRDESALDVIAGHLNCFRPDWVIAPFGDVVFNSKYVKHEGYVVRDLHSGDLLLKIKSPYYLTKKFLIRGGVRKCEAIWDHGDRVKKIVEEEYYPLVDYIKTTFTKDEWQAMAEQQRNKIITNFLEK